jgi:hypothetical protein
MKPRSRQKHKGRREGGGFSALPHAVQDSPNWTQCSGSAVKLLCALVRQYNGRNNGDLCAARSTLREHGIDSPDTITWALRELLHYGLIVLTRQGGLHMPNLYAVTWQAIDECDGKLECPPTRAPPGDWKQPREPFKRPPRKRSATTASVSDRYAIRSTTAKKAA